MGNLTLKKFEETMAKFKLCERTDLYNEINRLQEKYEEVKGMLLFICDHENYGVVEMRLPDNIIQWAEQQQKEKKDG